MPEQDQETAEDNGLRHMVYIPVTPELDDIIRDATASNNISRPQAFCDIFGIETKDGKPTGYDEAELIEAVVKRSDAKLQAMRARLSELKKQAPKKG